MSRRTGIPGIGILPRPAFVSPDSVSGAEASRLRVPFPMGKLGVRLATLNLECKLEGRTPVRWITGGLHGKVEHRACVSSGRFGDVWCFLAAALGQGFHDQPRVGRHVVAAPHGLRGEKR